MKEIILGLILALGLSVGTNWIQHRSLNKAHEAQTQAEDAKKVAEDAAVECGESVKRLKDEADAAAKLHADELKAARESAKGHTTDGQKILSTAPSSTDGCKSIVDLTTSWQANRKLK